MVLNGDIMQFINKKIIFKTIKEFIMKPLLSAVLSAFLFVQVPTVTLANTDQELTQTEKELQKELLQELKNKNSAWYAVKKTAKIAAVVAGGMAVAGLVTGYVAGNGLALDVEHPHSLPSQFGKKKVGSVDDLMGGLDLEGEKKKVSSVPEESLFKAKKKDHSNGDGKVNPYVWYAFAPFFLGRDAGRAVKADEEANGYLNEAYGAGKAAGYAVYRAGRRVGEMGYENAKAYLGKFGGEKREKMKPLSLGEEVK